MTDWSPVGSRSSLAGDPDQVRSVASVLSQRVMPWEEVAAGLDRLDPRAVWAGQAVGAFDGARGRVVRVVDELIDMAEQAGRALVRWGGELEEVQECGRRVRDQARAAEDDLDRARRGLDEIAVFDCGEATAAGAGSVPVPWPGPDWPMLFGMAQDRRAAAQRAFERLEADHDRAARVAARVVEAALVVIDPADDLGEWSRRAAHASGLVSAAGDLRFVRTDDGLVLVDPTRAGGLVGRLRSEGRLEVFTTGELGESSVALAQRVAVAWALGLAPRAYARLLRVHHQQRALDEAGIDWTGWEVDRGAIELQSIMVKVYEFYGQLYRDHPELEWAGLANLVGPSFAAGFLDLGFWAGQVEETSSGVDGLVDRIYDASGLPPMLRGRRDLPPGVSDANLRALVNLPADELDFYETTFLRMQQEIFLDMGAMHQAWTDGGLPAIEEMHAAGLLERPDNRNAARQALKGWQLIDRARRSKSPSLLHDAADAMAFREQHDIVQDDYTKMLLHEPSGRAVTRPMTLVGQVSVPNTHSMREVDTTSNVARFEDRWPYFLADTLPAYLDLVDNGLADDLSARDMGQRVDQYRAHHRVDDLLRTLP